MNKQTVIMAQGAAFYGCAIVSVPISKAVVLDTINALAEKKWGGTDDGISVKAHWDSQGTAIRVFEAPIHAPKPTVLFDTGHAKDDLQYLNAIVAELGIIA